MMPVRRIVILVVKKEAKKAAIHDRVQAAGSGANEADREHRQASAGAGYPAAAALSMGSRSGRAREGQGQAAGEKCAAASGGRARGSARGRSWLVAGSAQQESERAGFFQRCLAKGRGATPEQRKLWRYGIYDQIREMMHLQGS